MKLAEQSLGGEDFAWILEKVPGAMIRLGTRSPGGRTYDLHQGDFVADERAIGSAPGCSPPSRCASSAPPDRARRPTGAPPPADMATHNIFTVRHHRLPGGRSTGAGTH